VIVLYDADCGFCRWAMAWAVKRDHRRVLVTAPIQSSLGSELLADIVPGERLLSAHVVHEDGSRRSAGAAVTDVLSALPATRSLGRLAQRLPRTTALLYGAVAAQRKSVGRLIGRKARRRADEVLMAPSAATTECDPQRMHVEAAIRTRRTHKAFGQDPVERKVLDEILELARWAPNHHRTNPWRFRVLGPEARARLKHAAGAAHAAKLDRAPTLIVASAALSGDPLQDEEDLHATAIAAYIVLLAAHARGLAGYWRTPAVLRTPEGRAAVGLPQEEQMVALIHLGPPRQHRPPPERDDPGAYVTFLD
jgi:nitroreductase/predicted DCC family thiol-disulfide oxidoreductase YuxK